MYPIDMLVRSDGYIIDMGRLTDGNQHYLYLVRYTPDGMIDATFANGTSFQLTPLLPIDSALQRDGKIQTDGKILGVGWTMGDEWDDDHLALVRLTPSGAVDNDFGYQGAVRLSLLNSKSQGYAVRVQPDGKIVVLGMSYYAPAQAWYAAILRLNATGTAYDSSFGPSNSGQFYLGFGGRSYYSYHPALVLQADGKIVAAGTVTDFSDYEHGVLMRLNQNGRLDGSFLGGGAFTFEVGDSDLTTNAAIQPGGKILIGGYSSFGNTWLHDIRISRHWN